MLRAEMNFNLNCQIQFSQDFIFHTTSESTFRFWLATGHNGDRTDSYAHKLDLYYDGAIDLDKPCFPSTFCPSFIPSLGLWCYSSKNI